MRANLLQQLPDQSLLAELSKAVAEERLCTARIVTLLVEVERRRLHVAKGHASLHGYCVDVLGLSESAAYKRIQVARMARRAPDILAALADGRLHLSGAMALDQHLTTANAAELIAAASRKTKAEIEAMIASRFPRTEMLPMIEAVPARQSETQPDRDGRSSTGELSPERVEALDARARAPESDQLAPERVEGPVGRPGLTGELAPERVGASAPRPRVTPTSAESFALHFTIARSTHQTLREVQDLLSQAIPSGDLAQIFDRALNVLKAQLEKRKYGATDKASPRRKSTRTRTIPAHVRREVRKRDGGRCTFVGDDGHRCESRRFLQFDHIVPVARGGQSTVENVRLRCQAHNQFEAERIFGSGFMEEKRRQARRSANQGNGFTGCAPSP